MTRKTVLLSRVKEEPQARRAEILAVKVLTKPTFNNAEVDSDLIDVRSLQESPSLSAIIILNPSS